MTCQIQLGQEQVDVLQEDRLEIPTSYTSGYNKLAELFANPFGSKRGLLDATLNMVCFVPLGFFLAASVFQRRIWWAALFCALLSLAVESSQVFFDSRFPCLSDWILNVIQRSSILPS